jgi:tRNA threonylcarbamoyladenosine biosynthesis protein TsaE
MQVSENALVVNDVGLDQLTEVARLFLERAGGEKIWLIEGEMGAGKTTFIKSICALLGVKDNMSSPTFSIVNEYEADDKGIIFHFDFYRLKNEREALDIGIDDYFYSGAYCFIEWSEKIKNLIPDDYVVVKIQPTTETTRTLSLTTHGREEKRI